MIKSWLSLLITMTFVLDISGQDYYNLVVQSKRWDVTTAICGYAPCSYFTTNYLVNGDTLINGYSYFKIYDKRYELESYRSRPTLVRENSDSMRVYRYDYHKEQDLLMYDFMLTEEDTIVVFGSGAGVRLVVDSINEVTINDIVRKKIVFVEDDFDDGYWIEGIGSQHGLFYPDFNKGLIDGANWLNCVHLNDTLVFSNSPGGSCNVSNVTVKNIPYEDFNLYYDPLRFEYFGNSQRAFVNIFNINGILVQEFEIYSGNEIHLNQNEYTPGIYIFRIQSEKFSRSGKFIIQ